MTTVSIAAGHVFALDLVRRHGEFYVPAFDDWRVIAGTGTVTKEIPEQVPGVTCIVVPVRKLGPESIVTVDDVAIASAMARLSEGHRFIAEGAGAAGVAALLSNAIPNLTRHDKIVIVISGGNVDAVTYSNIINFRLLPQPRLLNDAPTPVRSSQLPSAQISHVTASS